MSDLIAALRSGPVLTDGAMGSLLFERTGRLSEPGFVYEALNLDAPEHIREIHLAYLRAGAQCLTTNSFSANTRTLARLGEANRLEMINREAVRLARSALETHREISRSEDPLFVLGSVGPTDGTPLTSRGLAAAYMPQIETLIDEGVDALLLESFSSLGHLVRLLEIIRRRLPHRPPVIAQMALHQSEEAGTWNVEPRRMITAMARAGAAVCGVNCCAPWEAAAFASEASSLPQVLDGEVILSAIPGVGGFQRIGGRYMTRVNGEYMGQTARELVDTGVQLVGGCCEVHPPYLAEMARYLRSRTTTSVDLTQTELPRGDSAGADEKNQTGPFTRKLLSGEFAVSVEILPARGTAAATLERKISFVEKLSKTGRADALDITDGSRGIPLMPPGDFIAVLRERLGWTAEAGDGVELIPHFTARDLNIMGLQARLMGYFHQRVHSVIFITGDPPKMSPTYPRSSAVFDTDSIGMINFAHRFLNAGVDLGGNPLARRDDPRTHFTIITGFEPESLNLEREIARLEQKIDAGADAVMTQPVFRAEPMAVLEPYRSRVPILAGVLVLRGLAHAQRMNQVPGVVVPGHLLGRLEKYDEPEDQAKEALEIAVEQVRWVRSEGWAGLYLMSPASENAALAVLNEV